MVFQMIEDTSVSEVFGHRGTSIKTYHYTSEKSSKMPPYHIKHNKVDKICKKFKSHYKTHLNSYINHDGSIQQEKDH